MRIPKIAVPLLVVVALFSGFFLRLAFTQPTTAVTLASGDGSRLECVVQGVKCKGTAAFFTSLYEGVDGIGGIETYAADHKVVFTYDPAVITTDKIREIMEAPVPLRDGSHVQVFKCLSMDEG